MPGSLYSWYGAGELETLARRGGVLSGEIDLGKLTRLAQLLASDRGSVKASLRFRQASGGWPIIELEYDTAVQLTCQRCLEPVGYRIEGRVEFAVLDSPSMEEHLPKECEPLVLEDERLMPAMLIEDELIISLPLVPRHEDVAACGSSVREADRL